MQQGNALYPLLDLINAKQEEESSVMQEEFNPAVLAAMNNSEAAMAALA